MKRSKTFIAIPPGETIKEQLEDRNMSQKEFASRMDLSEKHVSNLINGKVELTADTAYKLEMVLGTPANFWNNLEAVYREKLIKVGAENSLEAEEKMARSLPYNEMSKNGWVPVTNKIEERILNLRKFFEVVDLQRLNNPDLIPAIAYRRLSVTEKSDLISIVWIQKVKLESRKINTKRVNLSKLSKSVNKIRSFTTEKPADFINELTDILSECGVAFVLLPHLNGSFLQGATFYDRNKIVLGLTFRGKDSDKFWFSLFHEIGHILMGHLQKTDLCQAEEDEADQFSRNTLIPIEQYQVFLTSQPFSKESILQFSNEIQIDPGIIVGRLQKDGELEPNMFNEMKTKYSFD